MNFEFSNNFKTFERDKSLSFNFIVLEDTEFVVVVVVLSIRNQRYKDTISVLNNHGGLWNPSETFTCLDKIKAQ